MNSFAYLSGNVFISDIITILRSQHENWGVNRGEQGFSKDDPHGWLRINDKSLYVSMHSKLSEIDESYDGQFSYFHDNRYEFDTYVYVSGDDELIMPLIDEFGGYFGDDETGDMEMMDEDKFYNVTPRGLSEKLVAIVGLNHSREVIDLINEHRINIDGALFRL